MRELLVEIEMLLSIDTSIVVCLHYSTKARQHDITLSRKSDATEYYMNINISWTLPQCGVCDVLSCV